MSSQRSGFDQLFSAPPVTKCAVPLCDRRPLKNSRFCGCCQQDRIEGRTVIAGAGEILPFHDALARNQSGGPVPFIGLGDAAVRESAAFTARENRLRDGHLGTAWNSNGGKPARIKKRHPWQSGTRTAPSFAHVN